MGAELGRLVQLRAPMAREKRAAGVTGQRQRRLGRCGASRGEPGGGGECE